MQNRKKLIAKRFNDGFLEFGTSKNGRDTTGSKTGKKVFSKLGDAFFEFESIRQDDFIQYDAERNKTHLKVSTYFLPDVEKATTVKIEDTVYELNKIDPTKDRREMYWYLTKLGDLEDGVKFRDSSSSNQTGD